MPALRALLPRTKESSLTCASPAATIHLTYWLLLGRRTDKTRAARANCESVTLLTAGQKTAGGPVLTPRGHVQRHPMTRVAGARPHRTCSQGSGSTGS